MRRICLLGGFLLSFFAACGGELPPPGITSSSPAETLASSPLQLELKVDAVLPYNVSYGDRRTQLDPWIQVNLGPLRLYQGTYPAHGDFSLYLPSVLQPGSYDLSVRLADGRQGLRTGALLVDPGLWPNAYTFDPVDDQLAGKPFQVSLHALGGNAPKFNGNLTLSSSAGLITPVTSDAFVDGKLVQTVTLEGVVGTVLLTAQDSAGHQGTSNSFQVR